MLAAISTSDRAHFLALSRRLPKISAKSDSSTGAIRLGSQIRLQSILSPRGSFSIVLNRRATIGSTDVFWGIVVPAAIRVLVNSRSMCLLRPLSCCTSSSAKFVLSCSRSLPASAVSAVKGVLRPWARSPALARALSIAFSCASSRRFVSATRGCNSDGTLSDSRRALPTRNLLDPGSQDLKGP